MTLLVRSVLAVVAGYVTMAVIVIAAGVLFQRLRPGAMGPEGAPNRGYVLVNLAYSLTGAIAGGVVTSRLSLRPPMQDVYALAGFTLVMAAVSAWQMNGKQPRWYQITLAVVGPLGVLAGGWLRA